MSLTIDRVTMSFPVGAVPVFSPHGYVVTKNGTTYALLYQWYHGVVIAMLHPELLPTTLVDYDSEYVEDTLVRKLGTGRYLTMPEDRDDINVFDFQKFEGEVHSKLGLIRICPSRMMGPPSVDLPEEACTPEQQEALRLIMTKALGYKSSQEIAMNHRDTSLKKCLLAAAVPESERK